MKISIVYVSQTGTTETAAEFIQDGILAKFPFMEIKLMNIHEDELDVDFLAQSAAVIFGSPVYFSSMSWELKKWFDHSMKIDLHGKVGAAFITAQSPTGGTDTAIAEIHRHMIVKGMLVCSGFTSGAAHKFQRGAIGTAREIDATMGQFENFGAGVAQTVVRLLGK